MTILLHYNYFITTWLSYYILIILLQHDYRITSWLYYYSMTILFILIILLHCSMSLQRSKGFTFGETNLSRKVAIDWYLHDPGLTQSDEVRGNMQGALRCTHCTCWTLTYCTVVKFCQVLTLPSVITNRSVAQWPCTVYSEQCKVYSVQCRLYTVQFTLLTPVFTAVCAQSISRLNTLVCT